MFRWPSIVVCTLLCAGDFLRVSGNSKPTWSDQVETHLLLSAAKGPKIVDAKVYFDREANELAARLREVNDERTLSDEQLVIYRFGQEARMSITGHKCDVGPDIERSEKSVPFLEEKNGEKNLKDFGTLFFFDPVIYARQVNFNWTGSFSIETTKWDSSFVKVEPFGLQYCNFSHYIASVNSGSVEEDTFTSLLKIEALCTAEEGNDSREMEFVIDFFWSKNSISDTEVFQQPPGVYCPFVETVKNFPTLSPYFSFDFTTFDSDKEMGNNFDVTSFRKKVWYDSMNNLIRKDNVDWKFDILMTMVGDYNSRLSYIVSPSGQCNINELKENDTIESGITLPGESFPLFPISEEYSPQYVGQRQKNGLTFDVWVNRKKSEDRVVVSDYYFPSNLRSEDNVAITYPVFIEEFIFMSEDKLLGSALHLVSQYRTVPNVDDQSTFDVTNCFLETDKTRFFLTFEGEVDSINEKGIKGKVWSSVLSSLKIDRMRLGAMEIFFINESSIIFSSSVVEDPKRLGYKQGSEGPSREQALKDLSKLINDEELKISLNRKDRPSDLVTLTATSLSFPFSADLDHKDRKPDKGKKGGFSSGALAAVGIAMLAVGTFQGIILLVAYIRYRKNDPLVRKLTASGERFAES